LLTSSFFNGITFTEVTQKSGCEILPNTADNLMNALTATQGGRKQKNAATA